MDQEAHTLRSTYGADVVALIIDDAQYCGIAYLGPGIDLMFSVTAWNCATGYYTFGHEIGHNFVSFSIRVAIECVLGLDLSCLSSSLRILYI